MRCTQCGAELEADANFCHNCGAQCEQEINEETEDLNYIEFGKETMVHCPNCGATLFPGDAFCNQCGSPVPQSHSKKEDCRCPKCNAEYQPGAQFCSVCGAQLGQVPVRNPNVQNSPLISGLKQVPGFISSYFKRPVETTLTVVEAPTLILPVILSIIYAVACGVQLYSLLQSFCDAFQSLLQNILGVFATTFLIKAPLWTSLIFGALYGVLFILLLSVALFFCTKLLRENCSFGSVLSTTMVQSFVPSILLLAAAVITLLSPWLGIMLFLLSQISWIVLTVLGLSTLSNRSQSGRFWFPFISLLFVALLVFNFIVFKTNWQLAKNIAISYEDESMTISEIMESEDMSGAEEFFGAVFKDLF